MRGRDAFKANKTAIAVTSHLANALPSFLRKILLEQLRHVNGYLGLGLRYALCKASAKSCGECVGIFPGVYLLNVDRLSVGDNVSIHPMCYIDAAGGIQIGDNVSIAHSTTILSAEHIFKERSTPIRNQGVQLLPTVIEDNCWVGAHVTILGGCRIGTGCVVAAGSVVTKDVEPNSVVAGVPAKVMKTRGV